MYICGGGDAVAAQEAFTRVCVCVRPLRYIDLCGIFDGGGSL